MVTELKDELTQIRIKYMTELVEETLKYCQVTSERGCELIEKIKDLDFFSKEHFDIQWDNNKLHYLKPEKEE